MSFCLVLRPARCGLWLAILTVLLIGSAPLPAAASISGQYLSASGSDIVLSLTLAAGSSAIIVEQAMSAGNQVESTSPPANKVDGGKNQVRCKWLFKNVPAGTLTLTTRLHAPLQGGVRAVVRYRQPGGQFTEVTIQP